MKLHTAIITYLFLLSSIVLYAQPHQYSQFCNMQGRMQNICVRSIVQADDGMMWFAAENGIYSFDGYNLFKRDLILDGKQVDKDKLHLGSFNCMLAEKDSLLIGCNDGVLSFNLHTYLFRHLSYARHEAVNSIIKVGNDIWVATDKNIYKSGKKTSLSKDPIIKMNYENGCLYLGSYYKILRYDIKNNTLDTIWHGETLATAFCSNDSRGMWVGTGENVFILNGEKQFYLDIPVVKSICKDDWGNTLVGSDNGLYIIGKNGSSYHILHDARITESLAGDAVWSIYKDRKGNIWIGTNCGISLVQNNEILTTYSLPFITGEMAGNQLYCIYHDSEGRYWLGGTNGIICTSNIEKGEKSCIWYRMNDSKYPLRHNRVRCIFEDSYKNLWIGGDMGLCLLDENTKQFVQFRDKNAKIDWVYDMGEASEGKLKVTTLEMTYVVKPDLQSKSLMILSQSNPKSTTKNLNDEFLKEIGMQDQFLSVYDDKGTLIFGGTDKLVVFDTKKAMKKKYGNMPVVTDIRINDDYFANHDEVVGKKYVFQSNERLIQFYLSDFDYAGELLNDYYYQIEGETDWIRFNLQTSPITLNNLSAGTYTILIKRTGKDDKPVSVFEFTITAPWYNTTFAHIVYILFIFLFIYGTYRLIEQRKRLKKEREERAAIIANAKQKVNELLEEKDYLANQLRIQFVAKSGNENELTSDEKFLLDITRIIEENMDDTELNVNTLSEKSGISSKQLYRRIKSITGMATVAYIRDQRLKKAASLLSKGSFTVSEVMYMVGFSSASYFTRCFTEEYSKSPSEYKNEYLQ